MLYFVVCCGAFHGGECHADEYPKQQARGKQNNKVPISLFHHFSFLCCLIPKASCVFFGIFCCSFLCLFSVFFFFFSVSFFQALRFYFFFKKNEGFLCMKKGKKAIVFGPCVAMR